MKRITKFFEKCPCLAGRKIREDFLGPESGSVAIAHGGGNPTVKTYASGDCLEQVSYKFMLREFFLGEAGALFEKLSQWIEEGKEPLPDPGEGKKAQYIEITEGPVLVKTEVGAGVYEMKFRLVYYRKGVGNE